MNNPSSNSFELSEIKNNQRNSIEVNTNAFLFTFQQTEKLTDFQSLILKSELKDIHEYITDYKNKHSTIQELINAKSTVGAKAIHYSCFNWKNKEIIEMLIKEGADINEPNEQGVTIAHLLSYNNHIQSLIWFTEQFGLEIDKRDNGGCTPLHWGIYNNCIESIAYLLFKGTDLNAQDNEGVSPLHFSLLLQSKPNEKDKLKAPTMLVNHGASLTICDSLNMTPCNYAKAKKCTLLTTDYFPKHDYYPIIKLFIHFGLCFILLMLFPLFSCLFVLLPVINNISYSICYIALNIASIASFICFILFPSGCSIKPIRVKDFEVLVKQKKDFSTICLHCLSDIDKHYHCLRCKHCIDNYYHTYFTKCIGKRNVKVFLLFILCGIAFTFLSWLIAFRCVFSSKIDLSYEETIYFMIQNGQWLYYHYTKMIIGALIIMESMTTEVILL